MSLGKPTVPRADGPHAYDEPRNAVPSDAIRTQRGEK